MLDAIISLYAPHNCLSCGKEGGLWCAECRVVCTRPVGRCYDCHRLSPDSRTCEVCRRKSKLFAVYAAAAYEGPAKELVARLKFGGARAAAHPAIELMAPLVPIDAEIVVPIPTASGRVRTRGYDQALLLARGIAGRTPLPFAPVLGRIGQTRQVGADRQKRRVQLQHSFRTRDPAAVRGRHIILVDDVITTGATLEAAAAVLKNAGARRVSALVFARA